MTDDPEHQGRWQVRHLGATAIMEWSTEFDVWMLTWPPPMTNLNAVFDARATVLSWLAMLRETEDWEVAEL